KGMTSQRTNIALMPAHAMRLEVGADRSPAGPEKTLRIGDLVAVPSATGLEVRSRDGRLRFDLIDCLSSFLTVNCTNLNIIGRADHTPRISIDELVVSRERWLFRAQDLQFARREHSLDRLMGTRRWARRYALPRFLFVKTPIERKPVFLDLAS